MIIILYNLHFVIIMAYIKTLYQIINNYYFIKNIYQTYKQDESA